VGDLTTDQALARARAAVGSDPSVPGRAWRVFAVDGEQPLYYLVVLGRPEAAIAAAAVDAASGELMSWAELPGAEAHPPLPGEEALRRAGMPESTLVRLVWAPSRQSRSQLYPVWQLRSGRRTRYVDQTGRIWADLEPGGPGGGGPLGAPG
jgi:hypothetical protein